MKKSQSSTSNQHCPKSHYSKWRIAQWMSLLGINSGSLKSKPRLPNFDNNKRRRSLKRKWDLSLPKSSPTRGTQKFICRDLPSRVCPTTSKDFQWQNRNFKFLRKNKFIPSSPLKRVKSLWKRKPMRRPSRSFIRKSWTCKSDINW